MTRVRLIKLFIICLLAICCVSLRFLNFRNHGVYIPHSGGIRLMLNYVYVNGGRRPQRVLKPIANVGCPLTFILQASSFFSQGPFHSHSLTTLPSPESPYRPPLEFFS